MKFGMQAKNYMHIKMPPKSFSRNQIEMEKNHA